MTAPADTLTSAAVEAATELLEMLARGETPPAEMAVAAPFRTVVMPRGMPLVRETPPPVVAFVHGKQSGKALADLVEVARAAHAEGTPLVLASFDPECRDDTKRRLLAALNAFAPDVEGGRA